MLTKVNDFLFLKAHAQVTGNDFFSIFKFDRDSFTGGTAQGQFSNLLTKALAWVLAIVMLIAFIYLIMSGVKYITSGGDAGKATEARNGVINAIIGIVIVLLAFTIMRFAGTLSNDLQ